MERSLDYARDDRGTGVVGMTRRGAQDDREGDLSTTLEMTGKGAENEKNGEIVGSLK